MRRRGFTVLVCAVVCAVAAAACGDKKAAIPTAPTVVTPPVTPPPTPPPPPPPPPEPAALDALTLSSTSVEGQAEPTGTVRLTAAAPSGGAVVRLESKDTDIVKVPATVTVPVGATSATFTVDTATVPTTVGVELTATYLTVSRSAMLTVRSPALEARFSVSSASQGNNACAITNSSGGVDCTLDATQSSGFIAQYLWTFKVGNNESTFVASTPTFVPPTACSQLNGGSGGATVEFQLSLVLEDRAGNKGRATSATITLHTNGRCGY